MIFFPEFPGSVPGLQSLASGEVLGLNYKIFNITIYKSIPTHSVYYEIEQQII